MSKDIDWSKAPEGATHYAPKREENCMWRAAFWRIEDGRGVEAWSVNNDDSLQYYENPIWIASDIGRLIERPSFASWTGTGLPPVGTVCECQDEAFKWLKGTIVYVGKDNGTPMAIMQTETKILYGEAGEFRPIRTQAQIEAEEREKAIGEMIGMVDLDTWSSGKLSVMCAALYDAGYRKAEAGK